MMNQSEIWQNEAEVGYDQLSWGKHREKKLLESSQGDGISQLGVSRLHAVQCS